MQTICSICGKDELTVPFCPDAELSYTRHPSFPLIAPRPPSVSVSTPSRVRTWPTPLVEVACDMFQALHISTPIVKPLPAPTRNDHTWGAWVHYQTQILTQRCSAAGASEVAVLGDGNCFFRAVSLQIFGFEYFHSHVRQMCAAFLVDHRSRFEHWISENVNLEDYVRHLSRDRADVMDEIPLCIVAEMCNVTVVVVDTFDGFGWLRTHHPENVTPRQETIFLSYRNSNHYNALVPGLGRQSRASLGN